MLVGRYVRVRAAMLIGLRDSVIHLNATPPQKNGYKIGSRVGNFQLRVSGAGMKLNKQTILSKT